MMSYRAFQTGWGGLVALFLLFLPMMVPEMKIHLAIEILIFALP